MIINRYYPVEPVNIHIQSLINMIQDKIWSLPPKKGKGKLPLFCGNGERVNPIYGVEIGDRFGPNVHLFLVDGGKGTNIRI